MWIFFVLVILILILLIFFASTAPARPARTRTRFEPSQNPSTYVPEVKPQPPIAPLPESTTGTLQTLRDVFVPVASNKAAAQPIPFSDAEIRELITQPPFITGRKSFNWDAPCRLTGQTHRFCSCDDCKDLRSQHGVT